MKKVIFVLLACSVFGSMTAFQAKAQSKIGHINSEELFLVMPERDSAMAVLEDQKQSILTQSEELSVEYNQKLESYIQQSDSLSPLVVKTKEDELTDFQNRIRTFESAAQQELQNRQQELFQPIIDRAQTAIKEVAQENDFKYILDVSRGYVLYFPDEESYDILSMVKVKLGIE